MTKGHTDYKAKAVCVEMRKVGFERTQGYVHRWTRAKGPTKETLPVSTNELLGPGTGRWLSLRNGWPYRWNGWLNFIGILTRGEIPKIKFKKEDEVHFKEAKSVIREQSL